MLHVIHDILWQPEHKTKPANVRPIFLHYLAARLKLKCVCCIGSVQHCTTFLPKRTVTSHLSHCRRQNIPIESEDWHEDWELSCSFDPHLGHATSTSKMQTCVCSNHVMIKDCESSAASKGSWKLPPCGEHSWRSKPMG
jgi:hypothetical protein